MIEDFLNSLPSLEEKGFDQSGRKQWTAKCPCHEDESEDTLYITDKGDGQLLFKCWADCEWKDIQEALGYDWKKFKDQQSYTPKPAPKKKTKKKKPKRKEKTGEWIYYDAHGNLIAIKRRWLLDNGKKSYDWQRWHDKEHKRIDGLGDGKNKVVPPLYNLKHLFHRKLEMAPEDWQELVLYYVEGEKNADSMTAAGLLATSNRNGTSSELEEADLKILRTLGLPIRIIADNDDPGLEYAEKIRKKLLDEGFEVEVFKSSLGEKKADVTDHLDAGLSVDDLIKIEYTPPEPPRQWPEDTGTHDWYAREIIDHYQDRIFYCEDMPKGKEWFAWNGKYFHPSNDNVMDLIRSLARNLYRLALDQGAPRPILTALKKMSDRPFRIAALKDCQGVLAKSMNEFGEAKYPYHINCQNGFLDIAELKLLPHDPKYLCTLITAVDYDKNAPPAKMWLKALDEWTEPDLELANYLMDIAAYGFLGHTEKAFYCFSGGGDNGKSGFLNTIVRIANNCPMTGYAIEPEVSNFVASREVGGDISRPGIMQMRRKRISVSTEPRAGVYLDEGLLKRLTGGEPYSGRTLYKEPAPFTPQASIFFAFNQQPSVKDPSDGFWRRMKLIKLDNKIKPENMIQNIWDVLFKKEGASIFKEFLF